MAVQITDANYGELVESSGKLSVIDFWATWCGPCIMIAPIIEELAADNEGKVVIGKMNVDDNSAIPLKYGVRSIPTIVFIKDGKEVDRHVGATTKNVLQAKINALT
jgi:thioredoxin 1